MKLLDVLLKAMAKKITWWAAAESIGVSDRTMRRWRESLDQDGYSGLADRRKGKPASHRVPLETVEEVLRLYQEQYSDFNVRHFHEMLREQHQIEISYSWALSGPHRGGSGEKTEAARASSPAPRTPASARNAASY